jgi:hypothetical protein
MPETVLGLDVDNYAGKPGAATLTEAVSRLGPLPDTPISTSRDDGASGIRFFRVPAGRCWADVLGPGVELVHHGHRYAVAAPSVHPEGRPYRWTGAGGNPVDGPAVDDLPALPAAWVAELDRGSVADRTAKAEITGAEQVAFLAGMPEGEPCPYVTRVLTEGVAELGTAASRHDAANRYVGRLVRAGERGHAGAVAALDTLEGAFRAAVQADPLRPVDRGEWPRSVAGAVALVAGDPTPDAEKGCRCSLPAVEADLAGDSEDELDDGYKPDDLEDAHLCQRISEDYLAGRYCWSPDSAGSSGTDAAGRRSPTPPSPRSSAGLTAGTSPPSSQPAPTLRGSSGCPGCCTSTESAPSPGSPGESSRSSQTSSTTTPTC